MKKRTNFETMLCNNRDKDLFPTSDDFFAFCDFLDYHGITFADVVNDPTSFDDALETVAQDYTLEDAVDHFKECVSFHDRIGRTAESFARGYYLEDYDVESIEELTDDEKEELEENVKEAINHEIFDTFIFEHGDYIFHVGLC